MFARNEGKNDDYKDTYHMPKGIIFFVHNGEIRILKAFFLLFGSLSLMIEIFFPIVQCTIYALNKNVLIYCEGLIIQIICINISRTKKGCYE